MYPMKLTKMHTICQGYKSWSTQPAMGYLKACKVYLWAREGPASLARDPRLSTWVHLYDRVGSYWISCCPSFTNAGYYFFFFFFLFLQVRTMFERNADIAVSPLHSIPVISGTGKLTKRSIPKGAHSGNSGGEIAEYSISIPINVASEY